jgi:hypothetical protein
MILVDADDAIAGKLALIGKRGAYSLLGRDGPGTGGDD